LNCFIRMQPDGFFCGFFEITIFLFDGYSNRV